MLSFFKQSRGIKDTSNGCVFDRDLLLTGRGMTLIEVLFAIGVVTVVFMGIYAVFIISIDVVSTSKARAGALALAVERMEQVRSQPYSSLGTVGGIPPGTIPQIESVTLNQTTYTRRTLIVYEDDPADGTGASDQNGIITDYKRVKVEMTWSIRGTDRNLSLVSTIIPPGVESVTGGGILRIQAFDAYGVPVSNASVRIINTVGSPAIDVTTYTNEEGYILFPGTPSGAGYQITVTKAGYSTARTYSSTVSNPNPNPGHLSVATSQTTTGSFAIDRVASLTLRTLKPIEEKIWEDLFDDDSLLGALASTTISAGALTLESGATSGSAMATSVAPTYLHAWKEVVFSGASPSGTSLRVKVYAGVNPSPLPDSLIPGNSAGFETSPVDLSEVSTSTYPSLTLRAELGTNDPDTPPEIAYWQVVYEKGPTPIPDVPFSMHGAKTIGTDAGGSSIYKFLQNLTTNSSGVFATSTLEWDAYTPSIDAVATGYDISEACPAIPLSIAPNASLGLDLLLVPDTPHSLRVSVVDGTTGDPVPEASVRLTRTGVDITQSASECGQTFFSDLSSGSGATAYTLTISKTGYQSATLSSVAVSGASSVSTSLTPL